MKKEEGNVLVDTSAWVDFFRGTSRTAEEVAKAVMLLVDNAYMTGQTIALSGGMAFN